MAGILTIPSDSPRALQEKLSTIVLTRVMEHPDLVISVFAGNPAFGFYENLIVRARREEVDFSRARFIVMDELIRREKDQPFRQILTRTLFEPLNVPSENIISFNPALDHTEEVGRMQKWLEVIGIDLMLLSVDSRGHIGFHTQGPDVNRQAGLVDIENQKRWKTSRAFSLGIDDILRANTVLLVASGMLRSEIVSDIVEGRYDPTKPVSVLQQHAHVLMVADREALAKVERTRMISGLHAGIYIVDEETVPTGRTAVVVSPHPDDASISAGGAMALLSSRNNRLVTAVMTSGHRAFMYGKPRTDRIAIREDEVIRESRILGSEPRFLRLPLYDRNYEVGDEDREIFSRLLDEVRPEWIFLPQKNDTHPAHQGCRKVVLDCLERYRTSSGGRIDVWSYEGPWALFNKGDFNALFSLSGETFDKKIRAIQCHISQIERTAYDIAAESLARLRSSLVPEASLSGFGEKPPKLQPFLELYHTETRSSERQ